MTPLLSIELRTNVSAGTREHLQPLGATVAVEGQLRVVDGVFCARWKLTVWLVGSVDSQPNQPRPSQAQAQPSQAQSNPTMVMY